MLRKFLLHYKITYKITIKYNKRSRGYLISESPLPFLNGVPAFSKHQKISRHCITSRLNLATSNPSKINI